MSFGELRSRALDQGVFGGSRPQAQPGREVYAQECLLRGIGIDGDIVFPEPIFEAARNSDMLFLADLAARVAAVREPVRHGVEDNLFINFTPNSVYDPKFCLRSTVQTVHEAPLDHKRVVFEVTETEKAGDVEHLRNIVDYYREQGFRVALDDMRSGYSSLNLIHRLRPDFIKLDTQLVRGGHDDPYKAVITQKVLEIAQSLNIETIVEGVEPARSWAGRGSKARDLTRRVSWSPDPPVLL